MRLRDPGLRNATALRYFFTPLRQPHPVLNTVKPLNVVVSHTSTPTALHSKAQGRRTGAPWVAVPKEHEKTQRGLTTVTNTRIVEPRWGSCLPRHRQPRVRLRDPGLRNVTALRYFFTTPTALHSKAQGRRPGAPWVTVPKEHEKPQRGLTTVTNTRIVEPRWGSCLPRHRQPRVRLRDPGLRNVTALRYFFTTPTALHSKAQGRRPGAPWVAVPNEHEKPQRGLTTVTGTRIVEPRWGSCLPRHRQPRVRLRDPGLRNVTALRYFFTPLRQPHPVLNTIKPLKVMVSHISTPTALHSKAQGRRPGAPWVTVPKEHEKPQRGLTTVTNTRIVEPRWGSCLPRHRQPRVRLRDPGLRNVTALRYFFTPLRQPHPVLNMIKPLNVVVSHTSTPTALHSKAVPNEHQKPQRGLTTVTNTRIVEPRWGSCLPRHRQPRVRLRDPGLRNVTALRYFFTTPTASGFEHGKTIERCGIAHIYANGVTFQSPGSPPPTNTKNPNGV
ncbi:hypothetical protein Q31b_53350 [Novipirellula aureliae]|uniref:Uncharacterized protein n=1 Tax=Novipirellula aureliae TaxID=2527966 RepID=A0A5C6DK51_9BACT|nr:hypothetical protein Q31b_53350 [Novipirellula aureliae]